MTAEVVIVLVASGLGCLASLVLLVEAAQDRGLARASEPDLVPVADREIVGEAVRLIILLTFLALAVLQVVESAIPSELLLWGLVSVPVLICATSIYAWGWRRAHFKHLREEARAFKHGDTPPPPSE
jgi:hypothetical protein